MCKETLIINFLYILKIKSAAYSSLESHTGQLDFFNWTADGSKMG